MRNTRETRNTRESGVRIQNGGTDLPVAPGAVAADAGPVSSFEVGREFGQIACEFRESNHAADAMPLPGSAAAAFHCHLPQLASHGFDGSRALRQPAKID